MRPTHATTTFPTSTGTTVPSPITPINGGVQQPGLVLGGAQPLAPPPPPASTGIGPINPTIPGGTGGTLPNPGWVAPGSGLLPGGSSHLTPDSPGFGRGVGASREDLMRPNPRLSEGGIRAMAPGGVIGGTPGIGVGQSGVGRGGLGQSSAGRNANRRINPIGGVIGEGAPGSRRGVGAGSMSAGEHPSSMYGQAGGRRSGRHEDAENQHWDPDNPWETAEGVDPVVLPPRAQRIDPGPAIGLG
jgi:hypothetical protein